MFIDLKCFPVHRIANMKKILLLIAHFSLCWRRFLGFLYVSVGMNLGSLTATAYCYYYYYNSGCHTSPFNANSHTQTDFAIWSAQPDKLIYCWAKRNCHSPKNPWNQPCRSGKEISQVDSLFPSSSVLRCHIRLPPSTTENFRPYLSLQNSFLGVLSSSYSSVVLQKTQQLVVVLVWKCCHHFSTCNQSQFHFVSITWSSMGSWTVFSP